MDPKSPQPTQPLQPKANNPLKNYNTEAYVPEKNVVTEAEAHTSLSENVAQTRGEALQGSLQPQVGYNSTLSQKPLETPENGLKTQNGNNIQAETGNATAAGLEQGMAQNNQKSLEKHKKRGKMIAVIAILATALILGIAIAVVWWIVNGTANKPNDVPTGEPGNVTEEVGDGELVELALDDEVVQELYGRFKQVGSPWESRWNVYLDSGLFAGESGRYMMLTLATDNLQRQSCKGEYTFTYNNNETASFTECYSGEEMRQAIKDMFGVSLEFSADDIAGTTCDGWHYDVTNDEFRAVMAGCGGMMPMSIERELYRAEKVDDKIYLYERALMAETTEYYKIGNFEQPTGEYVGTTADIEYNPETESIDDYEERISERINDLIREYGDVYKWTFAKNDEGNYIFESLEKVEE